jgi:hypothetical protein
MYETSLTVQETIGSIAILSNQVLYEEFEDTKVQS